MSSPLAHLVAGAAIAAARKGPHEARTPRGLLAIAALWALLPDIDFLPGLLVGTPARFHQGLTHSLLFPLVAGCVGGLLLHFACGGSRRRLAGTLTLATASHLLLDYLVLDRRPPAGLPLLWPISAERFDSPVPLLLGIRHALTADASIAAWLGGILSPENLLAVLVEIAWIAAFFVAVRSVRARRSETSPGGGSARP